MVMDAHQTYCGDGFQGIWIERHNAICLKLIVLNVLCQLCLKTIKEMNS